MRNLIFTLSLIIISTTCCFAQAQLFGFTKGEAGKIIKFDVNTKKLSTAYNLTADKAEPAYNDLLLAQNGRLYGMSMGGGEKNYGILFSYDPASGFYTKLADFNGANGRAPYGSLVEASNGILYGMTQSGGANNHGTIFSYNYKTNKLTLLHSFTGNGGRSPYGSLYKAKDGKLYGMTASGGANDLGTIFSFSTERNEHKVLHHFDGSLGQSPYGSLVQAEDGKLYGMTQFGGAHGFGVVFLLLPGITPAYTKLADFNWTNGAWPNSSFVAGKGGKLYGMTESGGANNYGVIFSFDINNQSLSNISQFSDANGRSPYGSLVMASDKKLYGMTSRGGSYDKGVLFSIDPVATVYKKQTDFNGTNGLNPAASLIEVNNVILPLTLINFSAITNSGNVALAWTVEKEYDIEKYEIERSNNGINFSTIGFVAAVNSESAHHYFFTDAQPAGGKNYYRIKIHERYTAPHYTPIKVVTVDDNGAFTVKLLPNPATSKSQVYIKLSAKSNVQVKVYNLHGHLVKQASHGMLDKGNHYLPLWVNDIAAGSYMVVVETNEARHVVQLIKPGTE